MRKIIGHLKEHAGIWTFGIFIVAAAGGIYQFTTTLVSAQITPVKVRVDAEVKRLDAADQNTNSSIAGLGKRMNERFDELKRGMGGLKEDVKLNRERISLLDQKINRLDEKLDRKITLLDQKLDKEIRPHPAEAPPTQKIVFQVPVNGRMEFHTLSPEERRGISHARVSLKAASSSSASLRKRS